MESDRKSEQRKDTRERKRRSRAAKREPGLLESLTVPLRSKSDVLDALELACRLAVAEPFAARTIVMAAKASGEFIQDFPWANGPSRTSGSGRG